MGVIRAKLLAAKCHLLEESYICRIGHIKHLAPPWLHPVAYVHLICQDVKSPHHLNKETNLRDLHNFVGEFVKHVSTVQKIDLTSRMMLYYKYYVREK